MKYQITITRMQEMTEEQKEELLRRDRYASIGLVPTDNVLVTELTEEQFKAVQAEVLKVFK